MSDRWFCPECSAHAATSSPVRAKPPVCRSGHPPMEMKPEPVPEKKTEIGAREERSDGGW